MDGDAVELPIFELPLALLPGELLPLHIFEDRYKRMIGRCLERGEPFGIVFRDAEGGARRIGCEARVTEVTERFDDGRAAGRGAYVCATADCVEKALQAGRLGHAFKRASRPPQETARVILASRMRR